MALHSVVQSVRRLTFCAPDAWYLRDHLQRLSERVLFGVFSCRHIPYNGRVAFVTSRLEDVGAGMPLV